MSIIYITSSNLAAYIRTLTWDVAMGLDTDRLMGLSLRIFCFDTVFSSVLMHSCFVFFLALSCALCSYATAVFLCWLLLSVFTFGVRWHFWGFRLSRSSIQPLEFGYTLHRGASTTPRLIDSSCWASSIMVRACAFQRGFVHLGLSLGSCSRVLPGGVKCARPAILLLSSSAVKACLFPFLSSFDLIYTNSFFFGLGSSDERAYSWHKQQLTLFWSGRFVADIGNMVVRTSGGDIVFPDLEYCIRYPVELDHVCINFPSYTFCCYIDDLLLLGACELNSWGWDIHHSVGACRCNNWGWDLDSFSAPLPPTMDHVGV